MSQFIQISEIVLPVFVVIFLGYGLKRIGLIDENFMAQTNRLVFIVCLPLLLFYKIGTANIFEHFNGALLAGTALSVLITFAGTYLYAIWRHYPPAIHGSFCQGAFRGNMAIVGLAIVMNAYGQEGITRASVLMSPIIPLFNVLSIVALLLPHHANASAGKISWLRQVILNPLILACLTGIFWSLLRLPLPVILESSLKIITSLTLPLALLAIGAGFSFLQLRRDIRRTLLASLIKTAGMAILTVTILWSMKVRGIDLSIGVLMASSPTAAASYIMASQLKGDVELAGSILVLSTLISILTFSLILLAIPTA